MILMICAMLQCYLQLFIGSKLFCEEVEGHQTDVEYLPFRSSRPGVFCKKGVLRKFAKITGKHLCQSLFFNKVVGLRRATLLKKRLWHRWFPVNFAKFLRTPFFAEHLLTTASVRFNSTKKFWDRHEVVLDFQDILEIHENY